MKFGKVPNPDNIDFTLPKDHPDTHTVFNKSFIGKTEFSIGCAKWNKQDLKGFYPRGTKDELVYYSTHFNSIELNATFYNLYPQEQFQKWYQKTPSNFKFYPKITKDISHYYELEEPSYPITELFLNNVIALKEKLGAIFLQMNEEFSPKDFLKLEDYINTWPKEIPLAIELRHTDWYNNPKVSHQLYQLYQENNISNIITDTAGRRDLLHMRLTNSKPFIRFVGSNHPSDFHRLDDWVDRIEYWIKQGLTSISFFIHQNIEEESVLLSSYFVKKLNHRLGLKLTVPKTLQDIQGQQQTLF
ncbi:hypothetical protein AXE80_11960 [Wenyingzhuangia fucanilytica]|uniref:DUF72 domain-containing protein n=1 Tax=Wenyingzhuangia fucanilytica TaxID=1790137 RepID=A0A1B1Y846_9FLAO|nr:DUF72 domain-containing protein [Wenyingzhuangia fucanilytica]ANW96952.1 hypothetical protein AXE80_11960 [Wenyingzhuangia fucanilytica]